MFVYGKFMIVLLLLGSRPLAAVAEGADPTRSNRARIEPKVSVETRILSREQHPLTFEE